MNGKNPDGLYYLEHQLRVPLETLFELVLTPENGYPEGTSHLFEKGIHGNTISYLKENEKRKEERFKHEQRAHKVSLMTPGTRVRRKIKANEFVNGIVKETDPENARVTILLDTGKTCCIFPDTLSLPE